METERFPPSLIRFAEALGAEGSTATFTAGNLKERRGWGRGRGEGNLVPVSHSRISTGDHYSESTALSQQEIPPRE